MAAYEVQSQSALQKSLSRGEKKANKSFSCDPRNVHSQGVVTPGARSILQSERLLQYEEKLEYYQ